MVRTGADLAGFRDRGGLLLHCRAETRRELRCANDRTDFEIDFERD